MKIWGIGQISDDERKDILDKHKSLYDGYRTLQPQYSNEQPLTVWNAAGDSKGLTVNNKGEVKHYTNMNINESVEMELDEDNMCECGGMMYEGECSECGWKMEEVGEQTQQVKDLEHVEDLNPKNKFDYVEQEIDEISVEDLKKGSKYKYKHPSFSDEIEFEDEYEGSDSDKMYQFKGKETHAMPKKGVEYFVDFLDEDDGVDALAMQDVTGQEAPHMATDMAPDGMDDDSDNDRKMMADGEMEEQGGNADDMDVDDVASAYNFVSGGPMAGMDFPNYADDEAGDEDFSDSTDEIDEDSFMDLIDADSDLEMQRDELEEEPEFESMESAWNEEEVEEQMGLYSEKEPAHHFKSGGPQQHMGPLARINDGEVEEDEDSSWEEIDEDLQESFIKQKDRIMEMMNRMKVL